MKKLKFNHKVFKALVKLISEIEETDIDNFPGSNNALRVTLTSDVEEEISADDPTEYQQETRDVSISGAIGQEPERERVRFTLNSSGKFKISPNPDLPFYYRWVLKWLFKSQVSKFEEKKKSRAKNKILNFVD